jgi:uncharacterized membrane protein
MSDAHGPIDLVVLEFPAGADGGPVAAALADLVDDGTILLYDLLIVRKEADGSISEIDLSTAGDGAAALGSFAGARSGLLGDDDLADAAALLDPGVTAAVLVYENAWAVPFVAAARAAGGEMVATTRLTAQSIMDALDASDDDA